MALAQLCGLPVNTQMMLEDEELKSAGVIEADGSENLEDVYSRRQDPEMIRRSINMLKGRERLAMGQMLPKIALVGPTHSRIPT